MREPWFRIIEVCEPAGRSMADIAHCAAEESRLRVADIRAGRQSVAVRRARHKALSMIKRERPDLTSSQVAAFFNLEGSTVRHVWRRIEEIEGSL